MPGVLAMSVTFEAEVSGLIPFTVVFDGAELPPKKDVTLFVEYTIPGQAPLVGTFTAVIPVADNGDFAYHAGTWVRAEYSGATMVIPATIFDNKDGVVGRGGVLATYTQKAVIP